MESTRDNCIRSCSNWCRELPYHPGLLRSKKAILVLVWSLGIHLLYILFIVNPAELEYSYIISGLIYGILLVFYPLSGWIADVYITRFRAMFIGLWAVVVGSFIATIMRFIWSPIELVGLSIVAIGQALFEVNAIQFGLDQLQTYSTNHHQAYIYWFYWTMNFGHFFYGIPYCGFRTIYSALTSTQIVNTVISGVEILFLSVISFIVCGWRKKFNHHSVGFHPFTRIIKIVCYSCKKKMTKKTSGLQYDSTNGEMPFCLDRAKERFGGPFQTEQVEDTKVFFYILFLLLPLSVVYYINESYTLRRQFQNETFAINPIPYNKCLLTEIPNWPRSLLAVLGLPVFILVFQRLFNRINHDSKLLVTMGVGVGVGLLGIISLFGIQMYVRIQRVLYSNDTYQQITNNITECYSDDILNFNWLFITEVLNGLSFVLVFATALEFICAQAPYRVKGFLIGIWFSFQGLDRILISIQQFFQYDCKFTYFIVKGFFTVGMVILYIYAAKQYTYRCRQDRNLRVILDEYFAIERPYREIEREHTMSENYESQNILSY
jgi:peptide/histidine transporter 3/4